VVGDDEGIDDGTLEGTDEGIYDGALLGTKEGRLLGLLLGLDVVGNTTRLPLQSSTVV